MLPFLKVPNSFDWNSYSLHAMVAFKPTELMSAIMRVSCVAGKAVYLYV